MRRIAHISDLHFGTEDHLVAEGLLEDLSQPLPHLVVVSGDLTQRARKCEFTSARTYLDQIASPQLIVPGNHDIPLYNVVHRFIRPLHRYRHYITPELHPFYHDEEMAVAGINTARSDTWKEGRISHVQIERLRAQYDSVAPKLFKVLVCHHPFIPSMAKKRSALVGRASLALKCLEASHCALILSGHLHQAYNGNVRPHHLEMTRSILVAQAGTAISNRRREEPNAYNRITLDGDTLQLEVRGWDGKQFATSASFKFRRLEDGWCE